MQLINTYQDMLNELADAFQRRYRRKDVNITGILFARPESQFAKKEILPHIDYWHHRSDNYTDFFCPGYLSGTGLADAEKVATVAGIPWFFSNQILTTFLADLEQVTSWRYSGGCELIVTNARCKEGSNGVIKASLDLSTAMTIDLEKAHEDKAFRDVTGLAEAIFQFAKGLNEATDDPCWAFSDQQGIRIVSRSLKEFLLAYLPSWLKPEARKAFYFATTNIASRSPN